MTCGLIMTANPLTTGEADSVADATARLIEHRYINLPVVDAGGTFLGMFGITDVFGLVIPKVALAGGLIANLRFMADTAEEVRAKFREVAHRKVGEVADRQVRVVHPDTPEIEALRLFCQQHSTLAVIARDTRKLLGIVTYWDAMRALTGLGKA
jgi:CBS-domain-containing membrane protein